MARGKKQRRNTTAPASMSKEPIAAPSAIEAHVQNSDTIQLLKCDNKEIQDCPIQQEAHLQAEEAPLEIEKVSAISYLPEPACELDGAELSLFLPQHPAEIAEITDLQSVRQNQNHDHELTAEGPRVWPNLEGASDFTKSFFRGSGRYEPGDEEEKTNEKGEELCEEIPTGNELAEDGFTNDELTKEDQRQTNEGLSKEELAPQEPANDELEFSEQGLFEEEEELSNQGQAGPTLVSDELAPKVQGLPEEGRTEQGQNEKELGEDSTTEEPTLNEVDVSAEEQAEVTVEKAKEPTLKGEEEPTIEESALEVLDQEEVRLVEDPSDLAEHPHFDEKNNETAHDTITITISDAKGDSERGLATKRCVSEAEVTTAEGLKTQPPLKRTTLRHDAMCACYTSRESECTLPSLCNALSISVRETMPGDYASLSFQEEIEVVDSPAVIVHFPCNEATLCGAANDIVKTKTDEISNIETADTQSLSEGQAGNTQPVDTQAVATLDPDAAVMDTQVVDTQVVDTQVVDTQVVDTQIVDTQVVDTQVAEVQPKGKPITTTEATESQTVGALVCMVTKTVEIEARCGESQSLETQSLETQSLETQSLETQSAEANPASTAMSESENQTSDACACTMDAIEAKIRCEEKVAAIVDDTVIESNVSPDAKLDATATTLTMRQVPSCEVSLQQGVKVTIRVNDTAIIMADVEECAKKCKQYLDAAEDNSLVVFYDLRKVRFTDAVKNARAISSVISPLHLEIEKKFAMLAICLPSGTLYAKFSKLLNSYLKKYPTKVPSIIDNDYDKCIKFLRDKQARLNQHLVQPDKALEEEPEAKFCTAISAPNIGGVVVQQDEQTKPSGADTDKQTPGEVDYIDLLD